MLNADHDASGNMDRHLGEAEAEAEAEAVGEASVPAHRPSTEDQEFEALLAKLG